MALRLEDFAEQVTVKFQNASYARNGGGGMFSGTGWVVYSGHRTYIVANRHVVESADRGLCYVWKGKQHASYEVVDIADKLDLALVVTSLKADHAAPISRRKTLSPGEELLSYGFPHGVGRLAKGRYLRRARAGVYTDKYTDQCGRPRRTTYRPDCEDLTTILADPGASGSAVFDMEGKVVGVICAQNTRNLNSIMVPAKDLLHYVESQGISDGVNARSKSELHNGKPRRSDLLPQDERRSRADSRDSPSSRSEFHGLDYQSMSSLPRRQPFSYHVVELQKVRRLPITSPPEYVANAQTEQHYGRRECSELEREVSRGRRARTGQSRHGHHPNGSWVRRQGPSPTCRNDNNGSSLLSRLLNFG